MSAAAARAGSATPAPRNGRGGGSADEEERCDLCGAELAGGPPPPAPPRGAADPLRLRALRRDALGRRALPADRQRLLWLEGFQLPEELWARLRIPIGLAFFMRSSSAERVVGALPEPGGRHRMRARARGLGGPLRGQPGPRVARRGRRGADRQPHSPSRTSTRSPRSTSATAWSGRSRRAGRGSPAATRSSASCPPSSRSCGSGPPSHEPSRRGTAGHRRRRRSSTRLAPPAPEHPAPSFAVRGARVPRTAVAPTLVFDLEVDDPSGRQVFTIALAVQIAIEPAQRRYDEETRERLTELLGEPGRIGVADADDALGAGGRPRPALSRARPPSRFRSSATTTSRSPRPTTSARSPTARCRWSSTSTAASTTRARTAASRSSRSPGRSRPTTGCRSRSGRR